MFYVYDRSSIRRLERSLGLSEREFAKRAGLSHATLSFLNCHKGQSPTLRTLEKILKVYKVNPMLFFKPVFDDTKDSA